MARSAIGGFAEGFVGGMRLREELDDNKERRALRQKQSERDEKRFSWESADQEEKSRRRELLKQAETEYAAADEFLSRGEDPQQPQAIANPSAAQPGMAEPAPRSAAIAAPGVAPSATADAAPQAPRTNPFLTGAEKFKDPQAAMDRYYSMKESALRKLYTARGEYDKAEAVPEQMRKLRESQWSQKVGASMAAMAGNAPGARDAFATVYGMINDGYELDPKSGTFDPEKGWTGLERVNAKGERERFDLSPQAAATIAMKYKDPSEVVKFLFDRADKAKAQANDERRTRADERRATASEVSARATADRAAYLNKREDKEDTRQQQAALVTAVGRIFPLAGKEFKDEELMGPDAQKKMERKAADERMMNKTIDLAGLNPKVNLATLASIARAGKVEAQRDADGRVFTIVGNTKVYLQ